MSKPLRNLGYAREPLLGNYTVIEASMMSEVAEALSDWPDKEHCVLIGGLAVSFYCKPRATQDVDFLCLVKPSILSDKFKLIRPHAYLHKTTHVEIETLTSTFLSIPTVLAQKVFDTARLDTEGFRVASPEALVVLKTFRWNYQDMHDIESLFKVLDGNLKSWPLTNDSLSKLTSLLLKSNTTKTWTF